MPDFLRIVDGQVVYPYDLDELRKTISLRENPDARDLARFSVFHVHTVQKPADEFGKAWVKDETPTLERGLWRLSWAQRDMTAEELATVRADMAVSRMQLTIALASMEIITPAEAEGWVGGTSLPLVAVTAINASPLSDVEKMGARIKALGAQNVHRNNPLTKMIQTAASLTEEQVDQLFINAAQID